MVLRGHAEEVTSLCHLPGVSYAEDSDLLASGDLSGAVFIWSMTTYRPVLKLPMAHSESVLSVLPGIAGCSSRHQLATLGRDDALRLWDLEDHARRPVATLPLGSSGFCNAVAVGGSLVAGAASGERGVALVDVTSGKEASLLVTGGNKSGLIMYVARGAVEHDVIACCEDGSLAVWDARVNGGCRYRRQVTEGSEPLLCVALRPDGGQAAVGAADKILRVYNTDWTSSVCLGPAVASFETTKPGNQCAAYRPDGAILATGGWDCRVRLFDSRGLGRLAILKEHRAAVSCVEHHPTVQGQFATGSRDKRIAIWSIYS